MSCKYDIIDEDGRKRVRALRHFTVQGRDVCPMELGGYVYDANTLSQDGNCWIFSGSLEYPGVRVMDEAIVDMGNNLPKDTARPKATIISGNSRIMGAISFETQSFDTAQTPAMFEQGGYTATVGMTPVKASDGSRIRIAAALFGGSVGKVAVTSASYEARIISLDSDGLVMDGGTWTAGGPAVTLTTTSPYFLVEVRKTPIGAAITPADVTEAGVTITQAREATVRIFNSSIVPVYNGSVTLATNILRYEVTDLSRKPYQVNIQNSYLRIECSFNKQNTVRANADFTKVNYNLVLSPSAAHYISGTYRNTNINTPASVNVARHDKSIFDVSDCPDFEFSTVTFPDLAAMYASGKTFYFRGCNMPAGSAIHYYDPKVNTWDNLDFTKAMADLGKTAFVGTTIISSNVQGMYRARGNASGSIGGLLEAASSFDNAVYDGTAGATYDCITYKDCVVKGKFTVRGRCVFGGTQGGASRITNTKATAMVVDGNFRIDGNAQVTDTSLKGTGYIGGNAELKNGVVEGYIYMADNAKFIPPVVANPPIFRNLIMTGNSQLLKLRNDIASVSLKMSGNSIINGTLSVSGEVELRDNAIIDSTASPAIEVLGKLLMTEKSRISGAAKLNAFGNITLVGTCTFSGSTAANFTRRGKLILATSDTPDLLPPTKTTW
ncbi:hypothetical protein SJC11_4 [Bacteroides phage SJC11]|nr:hypothetical protein SJC09_4 [Bacteroides phage SJC09]QIG65036.1 hypothetical protein SJC11_4 [Bacteroides phage SJC11]